jgi:hypothetical protein
MSGSIGYREYKRDNNAGSFRGLNPDPAAVGFHYFSRNR